MNKKLLCLLMFVFSLGLTFTACSSDDDDPVNLTLEKSESSVDQGATVTVKITQGNGDYKVSSASETTATVSVSGDVITITGVAAGETTITVTDKDKKTAALKVTVAGYAEQIAATYKGQLSVKLGENPAIPQENVEIILGTTENKAKVSLLNFSFDTLVLGDIVVDNIPVKEVDGTITLEPTTAKVSLLGGAIEADVTVQGTVKDGNLILDIDVPAIPMVGDIKVAFDGDKI